MKPVAPALLSDDDRAAQPTLHSEIRALCDNKGEDDTRGEALEAGERITIPAPPTEEALLMSTPFPPRHDPDAPVDTLPAPPPSSCKRRSESNPDFDNAPSTIPGPPRIPRIAGV
ncbi:MAG: hypothetical protein ABSE49_02680 [Polyangiaceae bacterium]|jgi:hypothetical protein